MLFTVTLSFSKFREHLVRRTSICNSSLLMKHISFIHKYLRWTSEAGSSRGNVTLAKHLHIGQYKRLAKFLVFNFYIQSETIFYHAIKLLP